MKHLLPLLILISLTLTGCSSLVSRPVLSPFLTEEDGSLPPEDYTEVLLTSLSYGKYDMRDAELPFYHNRGSADRPLKAGGTVFENGVYISPISSEAKGFVEFSVSHLSEEYNTFVCMAGALEDETAEATAAFTFLVDGKLMSRTPIQTVGQDAYLIDVVIPYGAKTLRIECAGSCAGVIGDGRFVQSQYLDRIRWPDSEN